MNVEKNEPTSAGPLTVLFSFLSRADPTPLDQRSRAEGHILGRDGRAVPDPAADPGANAFEPDPNINFEKWGEYWRKAHGVRFLHPDEAGDRVTIERLLRYDQIHRAAPGPTSLNPPPYRPALDADGGLFDTIIGHVDPYRRPRWDGAAYLNFANLEDLVAVLGSERFRRKIMPEDRTIFRDLAPVLTRQFILLANAVGNEGIVLVKTHVRRDELDREAFQRRWLADHSEVVLKQEETQGLVRRYVQLHNIGPVTEGEPFYHAAASRIDGVTLMGFSAMKDVEIFLQSEGYAAIEEDERSMTDAGASEYWTGVNFSVVDQLSPETITR